MTRTPPGRGLKSQVGAPDGQHMTRTALPQHEQVVGAAQEALRFEHAHAEASRSRAAGMLTACGVLLALTVGLGNSAVSAAAKIGPAGEPLVVAAGCVAAIALLAAAVLSGLVFAPSRNVRTPVDELRDYAETRFRVADGEDLADEALVRLAAARAANLVSRRRILTALVLYVVALSALGAQVLMIAALRLGSA